MNEVPISKQCVKTLLPVRDALDVISGKWRIQIIIAIQNGCEHFTDIKMLSKELKALEEHKLVVRIIENGYPVKITYRLDDYAATLTPVIHALRDWGKQHRERLFP